MDVIADGTVLTESLNKYFGFSSFKGEQETIIKTILKGEDTFVIMPTGGGKSLCYQLPALMQEGTALVISPLIALMKNQVDMMRGFSSNDSIAHFLNSSLNRTQTKQVKEDLLSGKTKMLYVAPETLTKESTINFFKELNISFVAIDEAHCISEWGHDFRPEYRKIKEMLDQIRENIPLIALTATATPKVRADIIKTLKLTSPKTFISSFNRENLYYEVRPKMTKTETIKNIIQFVKQSGEGKSGIVYCLNRKTTEEIAESLLVNGIKAAPYHAGLDSSTRSEIQDQFLMEDVDVICATIAFGMGIDKPDVRFVIHFDIPKSLENYYQETGRAGRDGLEGNCIAYFSHADINKLDKFLRDKSVKEREIGGQHLLEVVGYSEIGTCRRDFLLHYFGENPEPVLCNGMCDNCANPKEKQEGQSYMKTALEVIHDLGENYKLKYLINFLVGNETQDIITFKHNKKETFGIGKEKDALFWSSVLRQALLKSWLKKEIENYGILYLSDSGKEFIKNPVPIDIVLNNQFANDVTNVVIASKTIALDEKLFKMLKDLRRVVAKSKNLPPFVIFQDTSLNDMATQYPIKLEEMENIVGVSRGKAMKFGRKFVELIKNYVDDNNIERPSEFVTKQVANKSKRKIEIIQSIDKKVALQTISDGLNISLEELFIEIETIVSSGTKVNIDYFINDYLDEDQQEEIHEYFLEAETEDLEIALKEIDDDDYTIDDIRMMKVKFMSDLAN